jgi:7,8-dihydropterin-6-yl-methyl-4-(beta-D-ribofuranosyl)aminobenzene 5'-phosphate synthase
MYWFFALLTLLCFNIGLFEKTEAKPARRTGEDNQKERTVMNKDSIKLTILYDNYLKVKGTKADWGFSCLIEGIDKTILFDTGADTSILKQNMAQMNVNPSEIDQVVISHMHWDHTGGLDLILARNKEANVFIPPSADENFVKKIESKNHQVRQFRDPKMIQDHVYLSGELGSSIKEQSLIIDTSEGLLVITGCSHPGIANILRTARTIIDKDIALVAGGFHLLRMNDTEIEAVIDEFEEIGVIKCAASHCTGDDAIQRMKAHYAEDFIPLGTGATVTLSR